MERIEAKATGDLEIESEVVIRIRELRKTFRTQFFKRVEAVRDVSFDLYRGELLGILGANGAGKTTTIKLLMNLIRPSSGEIRILGGRPSDLVSRSKVGYLPEAPYFYDYLSGRELVLFMARLSGFRAKDIGARADMLFERLNLVDAKKRSLRYYSKGMLQKLGLIQALIHDPEIIVLDEPLSGLDPVGRKVMREMIVEQRAQGKSILLCSHILSDVEAVADRVVILSGGNVVKSGRIDDLVRKTHIEVLYEADLTAEQYRQIEMYGGQVTAGIKPKEGPQRGTTARHRFNFPMKTAYRDLIELFSSSKHGSDSPLISIRQQGEDLESLLVRHISGDQGVSTHTRSEEV